AARVARGSRLAALLGDDPALALRPARLDAALIHRLEARLRRRRLRAPLPGQDPALDRRQPRLDAPLVHRLEARLRRRRRRRAARLDRDDAALSLGHARLEAALHDRADTLGRVTALAVIVARLAVTVAR